MTTPTNDMTFMSLYLDQELKTKLRVAAAEAGISMNAYIIRVLVDHLK